jgi:NlpC/P60 family putative phage cell wall peptidase
MTLEAEQRQAVVAEALTWLGTPYHHRACVKGAGVDCAMLPLAVYKAVGFVPEHTEAEAYPQDWHLHRDEERYLAFVRRFAREIEREALGPGDFVVWRWGRTFSHGAIVLSPPRVIHAFVEAERVSIDDMSVHEELRTRPVKCFSLW